MTPMTSRHRPLLWVLLILIPMADSFGQVPDSLAIQAYLTDDDGGPLNVDDITLTFRLYDAVEGGSELWVETQAGIAVKDGVYSTYLGRLEDLDQVAFDRPVWLSVARGDAGASELEPRIPLVTSPSPSPSTITA